MGSSLGGASSGKMLQSSLNSVISYGVKQHTGKTPLGHALAYAEEKNPEKKKETCFSFIESTRSEFCTIAKKQMSLVSTAAKEKVLEISDKYALSDFPHNSDEKKQEWLTYRQNLRDLPKTQTPILNLLGVLENVTWPTKPS